MQSDFKLMGILNITTDSFSDGGRYLDTKKSILHAQAMINEGADIIDIGAESTYDSNSRISAEEEIRRIQPVLQAICAKTMVSVDTYKSQVADFVLQHGAKMINDVTTLRGDPKMLEVLLKHKPYICLMYSSYNHPWAGRQEFHFDDIVKTISGFLQEKIDLLLNRGFPKEKIIIDPGLGFFLSTDAAVSWEVLHRLGELEKLGYPLLVGTSMKSYLGGNIEQREEKSIEAACMAIKNGAKFIRVHDVKAHRGIDG